MEDVFVARQPILDKNRNVHAYELLFRDGMANMMPQIEGDVATTTLLANTFVTIGMDTLCEGKKTFINFTQNLIEKHVPLLLPRETTVVEILEDVNPGPLLIDACQQISSAGYIIALDDFVYAPELEPLIDLADIIKFDFQLTPVAEIEAYLKRLPKGGLCLLAEKVETASDFEAAKAMGFELFQGYFFCKPEIVKGREIKGFQLNLIMLLAQINSYHFSIERVEAVISRDLGISYKLFKYANSVFFGRVSKISSVKQALTYLGEDETRRFVSLVAMSRLAEGKPDELLRMACVRGKFCELLGLHGKETRPSSEMFTLGLFSLIDAVTDQPMGVILGDLPLAEPLKQALIHAKGRLGGYLELMRSYETGRWDRVSRLSQALGLDGPKIPSFYLRACEWSDAAKKAI
ncbi:putative EAL and modified HD-GYP domain-containing signal transduction protein [Desulfosarcina cetonica]|uniref:EAL and HDOD domain-containing protein n=1 Tax=Desulfosarcina cetonica TaxID=90730 RepID=UPI0006CF2C97|nr:HDOD domain-containing protein [Desulfosarcina cetonica]VTR69772.1 putative EAL and modified HD-GYP domain-containing signal transduction protein [Desulfosarcina cetonica]